MYRAWIYTVIHISKACAIWVSYNSGFVEKTFGKNHCFSIQPHPNRKLISTNSLLWSLDAHLVWTHHIAVLIKSGTNVLFAKHLFCLVNLSYPGSCSSFGYPKVWLSHQRMFYDIFWPVLFGPLDRQNWWKLGRCDTFSQAFSGSIEKTWVYLQGFQGGLKQFHLDYI